MSLYEKYQKEAAPTLVREFDLKNKLAAPKVTKVVVNVGVSKARQGQVFERISKELTTITGQRPRVCQAKVSVAGFSLRKGDPIGLSTTLRGRRMYDFLEKLFVVVLPQVRDFKGLPAKSFDGRGNYTLGLSEQVVFPEIDLSKTPGSWGLEITMVTDAADDKRAKRLLELLGAPFEKG